MLDFDTYYRAMASRDARFDGTFYVAVTTTGVYCRPVCGSRTPKRENVRFFRIAAAAEAAGFRACRRCRPEAHPSSPEWNVRGDLVARALRLIAGGAVDEMGVAGVARQLAVSERHLHRQLVAEVGVGPLALALNRRNQVARLLIESSSLPLLDVAFAAGYSSIRQFNDGFRAAFGCSPRELRRARGTAGGAQRAVSGARSGGPGAERAPGAVAGPLALRLRYRPPLAASALLDWFRVRALPGVEEVGDHLLRRTLRLPRGSGRAELDLTGCRADRDAKQQQVTVRLWLTDLRDVTAAVRRCRDLLDLDSDPAAVAEALSGAPWLGPLVRARPGLRVPGCADGFELAVRLLAEQYLPGPGARQLCGWLAARHGEPLTAPDGAPAILFPTPAALAEADLAGALAEAGRTLAEVPAEPPAEPVAAHPDSADPVPAEPAPGTPPQGGPLEPVPEALAACDAVRALATAAADEKLSLARDADREAEVAALLGLPGVEPWTVQRIAMHVLGDPDAFDAADPALQAAVRSLPEAPGSAPDVPGSAPGPPVHPRDLDEHAQRWRPWRSYAVMHLHAATRPPADGERR
ncbi:DNA-3-methyladenine glycosylase 2 family protein [Streptomyces sp. TS71-3]|uniref:DNA-3-methyladenine glycosylase 2 family protein n=1 Tax=Streptomyces sp. TS71-3 TaxID=2733862 RepID=UPI001B13C200|nr:AlkA N-terminal domain-containing protein [Streptomyces sp. TS71-3]GHJ37790.1 DNA-3-methyladenine glycosylase [Streptomyces sp. TS71-3]